MSTDNEAMDNEASDNQEPQSELPQSEQKQLLQLLLDNDPDVRLETLFPRPGRYFSWQRFRKEAQKEDWDVPQLKQNAIIDKLVWWGFDPFMYVCITLFLFGLLLFVGVRYPLGPATHFVEYVCLGYLLIYVVFLFVSTGIEMIFGLYTFPDDVETVEQLRQLITRQDEQQETNDE